MEMQERPDVEWLRYPEAEAFVAGRLETFVERMPELKQFGTALQRRAGGRLVDWIDHLVLADGDPIRGQLAELGFVREEVPAEAGDSVYSHPRALFPWLVLRRAEPAEAGRVLAAALHVEDAARFLMTWHIPAIIEGSPMSPMRRALVWGNGEGQVLIVERRAYRGMRPAMQPPDYPQHLLQATERWATRPRQFDKVEEGMAHTLKLARALAGELGTDTACWAAFEVERAHWQARSRAGQAQRSRQDQLGLGWANHDHHTFRSSRAAFPLLIEILETFGFRPRERFYAGREAGWGAQVMEQPVCRIAIFADVDLAPEEVAADFAHTPLAPRAETGTVGLWCALHGESMLGAGLHHLAGRYDFDAETAGIGDWGIKMLRPFSDFSYLRQAFTQGERWPVSPERLESLQAAGTITAAQRAQFAEQGAIGSHLENIQRGEGFKGFNQRAVSDIIRRTDPRAE
jgi:hypothetical protein